MQLNTLRSKRNTIGIANSIASITVNNFWSCKKKKELD